MVTTSEKCITLSAKQYLSLAEASSYALIWAFEASFTLIHPKEAFLYVSEPASSR